MSAPPAMFRLLVVWLAFWAVGGRAAHPEEPAAEPAQETAEEQAPEPTDDPALVEWRRGVERIWLEGRLDALDVSSPPDSTGEIAFPRVLRDHWWRRLAGTDPAVARVLDASAGAAPPEDSLLARRWQWLAAGGREAFPTALGGEIERWPVLAALVLDRQAREWPLPGTDPSAAPLLERLLDLPRDQLGDEARRAVVEALEKRAVLDKLDLLAAGEGPRLLARGALQTARWVAALVFAAFVVCSLLVARRLGRPAKASPPAPPPSNAT